MWFSRWERRGYLKGSSSKGANRQIGRYSSYEQERDGWVEGDGMAVCGVWCVCVVLCGV